MSLSQGDIQGVQRKQDKLKACAPEFSQASGAFVQNANQGLIQAMGGQSVDHVFQVAGAP
jgi:hypothetical protein